MVKPITIHGVKFFDDAQVCIKDYENKWLIEKALSCIYSFGSFFLYGFVRISQRIKPVTPLANVPKEGFTKNKLVVCLHGLGNRPNQFLPVLEEMNKDSEAMGNMDVYIPHILKKGNAKLDDLIAPILAEIATWAKNDGEKELVLVGISNGGRMARAIEAELANSGQMENIKKLRFVSVVGACRGSTTLRLVNKLGLACLVSKAIAEEMPVKSERNVKLDQDYQDGLSKSSDVKRDYTFIAAQHDWIVPNRDSTLAQVPSSSARYAIVSGHGHGSGVKACAKAVSQIILAA